MKIQIEEAKSLAKTALLSLGYQDQDAEATATHLIDSELRGYGAAGLARVLSIRDRLKEKGLVDKVSVTRETPASAQLNGHDTLGYIVAQRATEMCIEKAKRNGIAVIGASGTWYTGMLAYYAEMAAKENLVTIIASNCSPWVAPEDGYKPMFGTNPFAVGFPSATGPPVIYDIGTSKILHADVLLAQRLGTELPPDSAYDKDGNITVDPADAADGAIAVWGGHRGSGLAITVQLLGILAGSPAFPPNLQDFGFFIIAVDPGLFRPVEEFKAEIDAFSEAMRQSPPRPGKQGPLRMPYERSSNLRARTVEAGEFEVDERVVHMLRDIVETARS
jgi:delta1-piperideine-2-carboxylate reductase